MAKKKEKAGVTINSDEVVDGSEGAMEKAEAETTASPTKKETKASMVEAEADGVKFKDDVYYESDEKSWPVLSRAAAILLGFRRYYLGTECVNGHISPRKTKTSTCLVCARERLRERHKKRMQDDPDYRVKHNVKAKERRTRKKGESVKGKAEVEAKAAK